MLTREPMLNDKMVNQHRLLIKALKIATGTLSVLFRQNTKQVNMRKARGDLGGKSRCDPPHKRVFNITIRASAIDCGWYSGSGFPFAYFAKSALRNKRVRAASCA
jgi:hypothetical protein